MGDEVYSMIHGDCVIVEKGKDLVYTSSKDHHFMVMTYNINGNYFHDIGELILFYRKGSEKYLTERPEPEVDWAKVPKYTLVYCADSLECLENNKIDNILIEEKFAFYIHDSEYPFWVYDGRNDKACGYKYCILAKQCKPEWKK